MSAHKKSLYNTSDFILYCILVVSFLVEYLFPTNINLSIKIWVGAFLIIVGWICIYYAKKEFKTYQQKTKPGYEISEMITTGIFQYSRNPTYLGILFIVLGLGFLGDSLWVVISFIPAVYFLTKRLILPEEVYLQEIFKEQAEEYFKKVRRWL